MSKESYQIRWRGKVSGPHDLESLKSMLSRGEVSLLHEVLKEGRWIPLEELVSRTPAKSASPQVRAQTSGSEDNKPQREEKPIPPKVGPPPPPNDQYYLAKGGQQEGPYGIARLRDLATAQAVSADDMVWKEGMPNWVALSSIIGPKAFERVVTREPWGGPSQPPQTREGPPSDEKPLVRPDCVTTSVVLMSVAASLGVVRALIYFAAIADTAPYDKPSTVAIFFCALAAVFASLFFLIAQTGKGRNWARVTLLVFYILGVASLPFALPMLVKLPAVLLVMDGAIYLLNLLAMIWVYMPDASRWFARVRARRLAELIK
jgi:hypothetical protein